MYLRHNERKPLDDVVNKYNKHIKVQIKWQLLMKHQADTLTLLQKIRIKILNLKLVILLEYLNIKIFLQKVTLHIDLNKFL